MSPVSLIRPETPANGSTATESLEPLFVDLDGTLLFTDLLGEGIVRCIRRNPACLFSLPVWLAKGRPHLKRQVAERELLDMASLPWNEELINFLQHQRSTGRTIVLSTASDRLVAERVSRHVALFDDVLATEPGCNLKGLNKLLAIRAWCEKRGHKAFSYVGDSTADLPIWESSQSIYVVRPSRRLQQRLAAGRGAVRIFGHTRQSGRAAWKALRPHQWVKNLLIFAPLVLAHQLFNASSLLTTLIAFVAFSLCASSVYLLNDLLDIESDRMHPSKRNRPIAAGELTISQALGLMLVLMAGSGLLTGLTLPWKCFATQFAYFTISTLYSVALKRETLVDVIVLASLYSIRLFMGGQAAGVPVSEWLLAFSGFLFLSLAFVKRYTELTRLAREGRRRSKGRGYLVTDLSLVENFGTTSGYLAVAVLILYVRDPENRQLYPNTWALWLICPLTLYWISRMWLFAKRRLLSEDPVIFAIRDRVSLLVGGAIAVLALLASRLY